MRKIKELIVLVAGMTMIYLVLNDRLKKSIVQSQMELNKQLDKIKDDQGDIIKSNEYTSSRVDSVENDIEEIQHVINRRVLGIDDK